MGNDIDIGVLRMLKLAPIALALALGTVATAHSAQAETYKEFGDRVNATAVNMMKAHKHQSSAENWMSSDAAALLENARFLEKSLDEAAVSCARYKKRKLWWSPIAYNRFTHELLAETIQGVPTFAPNGAQQEKIHYAVLASALAYEAEKVTCPGIVWRQK
jgi:hypothetical protein